MIFFNLLEIKIIKVVITIGQFCLLMKSLSDIHFDKICVSKFQCVIRQ